MEDLFFYSVLILPYILIWMWSLSKTYAHEHGYLLARHRWAQKIVDRAEALIAPAATFYGNKMELRISQHLENRLHGRCGDRWSEAELKEFYRDDAKILWMLLTVSYEAMLFSRFAGTELALDVTHPYQDVFDATVKALTQRGYDCTKEIEKCKTMTAETHEFCCMRNFNLFK